MFKKIVAVVSTALVLSVSSMVAQAATTFNFGAGPDRSLVSSFNMSSGGLDLTVSAGRFSNSGSVTPGGRVGTNNNGLGVDRGRFDGGQVDGALGNDVAIFNFNQDVKFESVTFSNWDNNDQYTFFVGDPLQNQGFNFLSGYDLAAQNYIASMFGIGAHDSNDNFRIASISVSAVPLPTSVLLFGGALLGLGWLSRRKVKAAAIA
ncbi:MAG: hypothetical protein V7750_16675 [Sneathiella sp.]